MVCTPIKQERAALHSMHIDRYALCVPRHNLGYVAMVRKEAIQSLDVWLSVRLHGHVWLECYTVP